MGQFVHLHLHSCYSLLDGACRIDELLDDAQRAGMPAVGLTDHGVLYGVFEFYEKAKARGIKPIIGCEMYVAPRSRHGRTPKLDDNPYHLIVLAENNEGYRNLLTLVSQASLEGFYYKPRIDKELLTEHSKGLIGFSACLAGEVPEMILKNDLRKAKESAAVYQDIFGKGNFFLEVQDHDLPLQHQVNKGLVEIAKDLNIPYVATNDVHYTRKGHADAHDVLLCIQTGKKVEEKNRLRFETQEFYLKRFEELEPRFREFPEAIENTLRIAERSQLKLSYGEEFLLPAFPVPEGSDKKEFLKNLCLEGMKARYGMINDALMGRFNYEFSVITEMGFADYFLIVWDFIRYAKQNGILVGPGRGSVAGSVVAYALGITEIDPLKYNLIFERFLNPGRKKMPDIDTDFCDTRRDEMIRYVVEKYGKDRVAQIVTFGTLKARAAVRDSGRVLGLPISLVDRVAKLIPANAAVSEARATSEIQALIQGDSVIAHLIDTAEKIEGLPRNASIHAAGVVIGRDSLLNHVAVQKMQGEAVVCQCEMDKLEKIGLLKMDFLGLRTLSLLEETIALIQQSQGITLMLNDIPLDDRKTFRLLSDAHTIGVFQLESSLAQQVLKDYKPDTFTDVIAIGALIRPGPLQSGMVGEYIKARHGKIKVKYPHPSLEPVLKETYGVFLYQEQVMQAAVALANFPMAEADDLRQAMGKKKVELMEKYREKFLTGSVSHGINHELAGSIWETMAKFAEYGFNKSHSAAYGLVSYWTAYLKANYPVEFMAATLSSVGDKTDKIKIMINECRRMGITVLPPDVNESMVRFTVVGDRIRFGLGAVKNIGEKAVEGIISARKEEGLFSSFYDFCRKMDLRTCNRKVLESLIKCGALDSFGWHRAKLLANLDSAVEFASNAQKERSSGQFSLFSGMEDKAFLEPEGSEAEEMPKEKLLSLEREMLGLYISDHPLSQYQELAARKGAVPIEKLVSFHGKPVLVAGIISSVKRITTKNNLPMAFLTIEDLTGQVEGVVFSKVHDKCAPLIQEDALVFVKGNVTVKEEEGQEDEEPIVEAKIAVDELTALDAFQGLKSGAEIAAPAAMNSKPAAGHGNSDGKKLECHIQLNAEAGSPGLFQQMKTILEEESGEMPVYLHLESLKRKATLVLPPKFFIKDADAVTRKFMEKFGPCVQVATKPVGTDP
jgi:DNA polymerase-3 subunit alpha